MNPRLAVIRLGLVIAAAALFAGAGSGHAFKGEPDGDRKSVV